MCLQSVSCIACTRAGDGPPPSIFSSPTLQSQSAWLCPLICPSQAMLSSPGAHTSTAFIPPSTCGPTGFFHSLEPLPHKVYYMHTHIIFPSPCACIQVSSLDPATHAYSFWEGVPIEGKAAFGKLFAASRTLRVRHLARTASSLDRKSLQGYKPPQGC